MTLILFTSSPVRGSRIALTSSIPPSEGVQSQAGTFERLSSGSIATVLVASGVPLPPGWLQPEDSDKFRILDSSQNEIPIYAEVLGPRHADGSVKIMYIETPQTLVSGTFMSMSIEVGNPRNTANDLTRSIADDPWGNVAAVNNTSSIWKTDTFPHAMCNFPASYLSTTQFWGPYDLRYDGKPNGPSYQNEWIFQWQNANNTWWNGWTTFSNGSVGSFNRTQYDFPGATFILWAMTGKSDYFKRACATLIDWRNRYFRTNPSWNGWDGGNIAMWEHCPWGLTWHHYFTGDRGSLKNIVSESAYHSDSSGYAISIDDFETEPRPLAFTLYTMLAAKGTGASYPGTQSWDGRITAMLDRWCTVSTAHPGWVTSGSNTGAFWNRLMYTNNKPSCSLSSNAELTQNFMLGLLLSSFDQYLDFGDGARDSDVNTRASGLLTFLMTQVGFSPAGSHTLQYNNSDLGVGGCQQQGATTSGGQVNVNGTYSGGIGVMSTRLSYATGTVLADKLLETTTLSPKDGDSGPWMYNQSRAFNETFHRSWQALSVMYP